MKKAFRLLLMPLLFILMHGSYGASFPDWHHMDQDTLNRSYNNSLAVPESKEMFNHWVIEAKEFRASHAQYLDIPYGPSKREKLDIFVAAPNAPTLVFIHGGFWQMRSKDDFAFIAKPYVKAGINVVMVGYPLAPEASMSEIVAASQRAITYVQHHIQDWQGDPHRVVVSGWSSGGHLTAEVMNNSIVSAAVPLSGIYDLEPLVGSYIDKKLHLSQQEVKQFSPMNDIPPKALPIYIFVGGAELSEMRRQSYDYAAKLAALHQPGGFKELPQKNHYTILADMINPEGEIYRTLIQVLQGKSLTLNQ
ncbi:carboxylesterase NlhH [Ferrovum sp. JA12]|uniref:alpha/beta hydrolase n=1 Tax=Ferrovum sp. JA12 TaxID=1356299 RepID=UPI0007036C95|nr:alpha/beta hydrolase [Ferrovum sp. JA12]KRH78335.1 carboxylesterase NlhH [Ferrovum sp. JA12]